MADIKKEQEREELHRAIWAIADELRGSVDGWDFKSYVLGTMFYRYISENLTEYINADEIAAGIEMAVAKRCFVMAKKAGATDSITLTGGCAKNDGLKEAIERVLKLKVVNLKTDPQLMGALGAAEYARQKGLAKK